MEIVYDDSSKISFNHCYSSYGKADDNKLFELYTPPYHEEPRYREPRAYDREYRDGRWEEDRGRPYNDSKIERFPKKEGERRQFELVGPEGSKRKMIKLLVSILTLVTIAEAQTLRIVEVDGPRMMTHREVEQTYRCASKYFKKLVLRSALNIIP